MGYNTDFEINIDSKVDEIKEFLRRGSELETALERNLNTDGYAFLSEWKWDQWHQDLSYISLMFPGVLITVDGQGEEMGDVWRAYLKDGRGYKVSLQAWPPFDPQYLGEVSPEMGNRARPSR